MRTALPTDRIVALLRDGIASIPPLPTGITPSPGRLTGVRHLAFDVYGTLLVSGVGDIGNSAPADRGAALRRCLARFPADPPPDADDLERAFLGAIRRRQRESEERGALRPEVDIREVWADLVAEVFPSSWPAAAEIEELAIRFEGSVNPVAPMPGLTETLGRLADRFAPFSIVSNAQFFTPWLFPAATGRDLASLGFDPRACVWSFEEREAKPSPRLFEVLLERLGRFRPEEVAYVGNDRLNDVAAARRAGLRAVLFAGDRRSLRLREDHPECRDAEPDLVITSLDQLVEKIG